jgi:hypothetical protein
VDYSGAVYQREVGRAAWFYVQPAQNDVSAAEGSRELLAYRVEEDTLPNLSTQARRVNRRVAYNVDRGRRLEEYGRSECGLEPDDR